MVVHPPFMLYLLCFIFFLIKFLFLSLAFILSILLISSGLYPIISTFYGKIAPDFPWKIASSQTGSPPETVMRPKKFFNACTFAATPMLLLKLFPLWTAAWTNVTGSIFKRSKVRRHFLLHSILPLFQRPCAFD